MSSSTNVWKVLIAAMLIIPEMWLTTAGALSFYYYDRSCPYVQNIVRNIINEELRKDFTLSAGLLRMHFHDCFVQGCDGSVLIDSSKDSKAEKDSPANLSLRGFEIIDRVKQEVESRCEGVVSCADILAMAARDAVSWAGGPYYYVPMGRKDGRRSRIEDTIKLPPPSLNTTDLIRAFTQHGFSVQDMVALSGGHTLGAARCASFKNRLSNFDSSNNVDPSLNGFQARVLSRICSSGDDAEASFDMTRTVFDNMYYKLLLFGGGVLTSDQTLFTSPETRSIVQAYADSQEKFFLDFTVAMVKMGMVDVKEVTNGDVRLNCRVINRS